MPAAFCANSVTLNRRDRLPSFRRGTVSLRPAADASQSGLRQPGVARGRVFVFTFGETEIRGSPPRVESFGGVAGVGQRRSKGAAAEKRKLVLRSGAREPDSIGRRKAARAADRPD